MRSRMPAWIRSCGRSRRMTAIVREGVPSGAPMRKILLALAFACGAAAGADEPEAVYRKIHGAAIARDLEEMRRYAAESERATLIVPEVPKTYRLTGKAARRD